MPLLQGFVCFLNEGYIRRRCWCFFTNNINLQSVPSSDAAAVDSAGVETPTGEKYLLFELSERNA